MQNILDPAILFFIFGVFAGAVRSNLEIPSAITKFLSLYLLMALGLKGGFALQKTGLTMDVAKTLSIAVMLAIIIPILGYNFLKRKLNRYDSAAIAAKNISSFVEHKPRTDWSRYGRWVNAYEPVNKGRLASAYGWKEDKKNEKKYY